MIFRKCVTIRFRWNFVQNFFYVDIKALKWFHMSFQLFTRSDYPVFLVSMWNYFYRLTIPHWLLAHHAKQRPLPPSLPALFTFGMKLLSSSYGSTRLQFSTKQSLLLHGWKSTNGFSTFYFFRYYMTLNFCW